MRVIKVMLSTQVVITIMADDPYAITHLAHKLLEDGRIYIEGQMNADDDGPLVKGYFYAPQIVGIYDALTTSTVDDDLPV